jgi:hypothetical protein
MVTEFGGNTVGPSTEIPKPVKAFSNLVWNLLAFPPFSA